jgi:hemin uptake protein HemP
MNFLSSRTKKVLAVLGLSATMLAFPLATSANAMDRDHDFHFGRPGVYYYPGYDWDWGWGWGGPFWGTYPTFYYYNRTGTVKLENVSKSDQVYLNGSYAGESKKLESMHLYPGSYTVTVKHNGKNVLNQQVYVMRNRTIKLDVGDKRGKLKLKDVAKADQVYVNGLYRGEARNLKSMRLAPGSYHVMITDNGQDVLNRQVYLPTNKTLDLRVGDNG